MLFGNFPIMRDVKFQEWGLAICEEVSLMVSSIPFLELLRPCILFVTVHVLFIYFLKWSACNESDALFMMQFYSVQSLDTKLWRMFFLVLEYVCTKQLWKLRSMKCRAADNFFYSVSTSATTTWKIAKYKNTVLVVLVFFFIEIHNFCLLTRHETLSALLDFSKGKGVIPVICSYIPNTVLKLLWIPFLLIGCRDIPFLGK